MSLHELFHGFSALSSFGRLFSSHPQIAVVVGVALVLLFVVLLRSGGSRGLLGRVARRTRRPR